MNQDTCSDCGLPITPHEAKTTKGIHNRPLCDACHKIQMQKSDAEINRFDTPELKCRRKLDQSGFKESERMPGFWKKEDKFVDLNKKPIQVGVIMGVERHTEGHGLGWLDDLEQELNGILQFKGGAGKKNDKKEMTPAPEPEQKKEEKNTINETLPDIIEKAQLLTKKLSDHEIDEMIEQAKAKRFIQGQGGSYKVAGKERPDSAMVQKIANEAKISVEILVAEQTDKYAHVVVRGYFGSQYVDDVVHHDFETEFHLKTMEIIEKNPDILDHYDGMNPVIKDGAKIKREGKNGTVEWVDAKYYLIHALLSFKKFSLRDATTKATSRVQMKLLNQDDRNEDEILSENFEHKLVESFKKPR